MSEEEPTSPELKDLTAVILAGGLGTRLRSITGDTPKVLASILGRPFLAYLLEQLTGAGVKQAVLCTGYQAIQVESAFGNEFCGMRLKYSRESTALGTGGALRLALPLLQSRVALVLNGDSYAHTDLQAFWRWHQAKKAKASIVAATVPDTRRYGTVNVNERDEIVGFVEKNQNAGAGSINAGIYLLDKAIIAEIPADRAVSLEREVFPRLIGNGFFAFRRCSRFLDIGTPESFAQAEEFFRIPRVSVPR